VTDTTTATARLVDLVTKIHAVHPTAWVNCTVYGFPARTVTWLRRRGWVETKFERVPDKTLFVRVTLAGAKVAERRWIATD
jgi:hypothetical protein